MERDRAAHDEGVQPVKPAELGPRAEISKDETLAQPLAQRRRHLEQRRRREQRARGVQSRQDRAHVPHRALRGRARERGGERVERARRSQGAVTRAVQGLVEDGDLRERAKADARLEEKSRGARALHER